MTDRELYTRLETLKDELDDRDPDDNLAIALSAAANALDDLCRDLSHAIASGDRPASPPDTVRVLRLLEYTGSRADVERDLSRRSVKVESQPGTVRIRETFLFEFPEHIMWYEVPPDSEPLITGHRPHTIIVDDPIDDIESTDGAK
jgi:hypothetical protein